MSCRPWLLIQISRLKREQGKPVLFSWNEVMCIVAAAAVVVAATADAGLLGLNVHHFVVYD